MTKRTKKSESARATQTPRRSPGSTVLTRHMAPADRLKLARLDAELGRIDAVEAIEVAAEIIADYAEELDGEPLEVWRDEQLNKLAAEELKAEAYKLALSMVFSEIKAAQRDAGDVTRPAFDKLLQDIATLDPSEYDEEQIDREAKKRKKARENLIPDYRRRR